MPENNKEIGDKGEELAVRFLAGKGYTILKKNWKHKHLEIDIIASYKDYIVIVEVKTRANSGFGKPESFVDRKKQQFLIKAANSYIEQNSINQDIRFDIISIIHGTEKPQITHIEDAFYPTLR